MHPALLPRLALLAATLSGAGVQAATASPPFAPPALYAAPLPTASDRALRDLPGGVKMFGDIPYAERTGWRPLKLDLYLPTGTAPAAGRPLVVWFHGGGYEIGNPRADWTWGDWSVVLGKLAARGYVVAGVSYRFNREAPFPAQLEDARSALAFLRQHAAQWNIDGSRVYAWGLSAGGHLAAQVGMTSAEAPANERVQGVAEWFGPTDLPALLQAGGPASLPQLLGCADKACSAALYKDASPVAHVTPAAPPTLILHGAADPLVPVSQGQALADRLKAAGVDVTFHPFPGLGHGFVGAQPAQLDAILDETFAFFDRLSRRP